MAITSDPNMQLLKRLAVDTICIVIGMIVLEYQISNTQTSMHVHASEHVTCCNACRKLKRPDDALMPVLVNAGIACTLLGDAPRYMC